MARLPFCCIAVVTAFFVGCDPAPKTAAPETSNPRSTTPVPVAKTNDGHAHAHGDQPKAGGKGKREVVRVGVESLDLTVSGGTIHLLLANYDAQTKVPALQHLRSTDAGVTWSAPAPVNAQRPPPHIPHRGMDAQIAASGQNLVAVWNTPGTGFMGRGPLATAISSDGGATWQPGPNPADDASEGDHSFVDCAADASGNFHLIWLDARGTNKTKGLRYTSSRDGGRTWSANLTLEPETCECCWNTLALGPDGAVHALYRDKNPRDMAVVSSFDRAMTWSAPQPVGKFNWDFQGCPHVGGGLLAGSDALHALVWTGAIGHSGAYHLQSLDRGRTWSAPQRLGDADARRGDLASASSQSLAAVWDRVSDGESQVFATTSADGGKTWRVPQQLSGAGGNAAYPRLIAIAGGYRVFWTEAATGQPSVWKSVALGN